MIWNIQVSIHSLLYLCMEYSCIGQSDQPFVLSTLQILNQAWKGGTHGSWSRLFLTGKCDNLPTLVNVEKFAAVGALGLLALGFSTYLSLTNDFSWRNPRGIFQHQTNIYI